MAKVKNKGARTIPAPLVLALASAMVSVGAAAYLWSIGASPGASGDSLPEAQEVRIDTRTAEEAAESFLDAWRKREHAAALRISTGTARATVLSRKREDEALSEEEKELKATVWASMAEGRLSLAVHGREELPEGRVSLEATANGTFLDHDYSRSVEFVVIQAGDRWVVEEMRLGDILSEMPEFLDLGPSEAANPSELKMRGEAVP